MTYAVNGRIVTRPSSYTEVFGESLCKSYIAALSELRETSTFRQVLTGRTDQYVALSCQHILMAKRSRSPIFYK